MSQNCHQAVNKKLTCRSTTKIASYSLYHERQSLPAAHFTSLASIHLHTQYLCHYLGSKALVTVGMIIEIVVGPKAVCLGVIELPYDATCIEYILLQCKYWLGPTKQILREHYHDAS